MESVEGREYPNVLYISGGSMNHQFRTFQERDRIIAVLVRVRLTPFLSVLDEMLTTKCFYSSKFSLEQWIWRMLKRE